MYILKNALRSVLRSKGRNFLIGIIIFVIAVSSCVALSIREAAQTARESSLNDLEITAQITVNRQNMMSGQESREQMKEALSNMEELTLEDMQVYADSSYVKDFYYTTSVSLNGNDDLEPIDTTGIESEDSEDTDSQSADSENMEAFGMPQSDMPQGDMSQDNVMQGIFGGRMGVQGDFTLTGYSSDAAMTNFTDGSQSITDGSMFEENDTENQCIISEELATYNELSVGDSITFINPNQEEESYTMTICGIYENNQTEDSAGGMMGGFSATFDSANQIYTSYDNLIAIADASKAQAVTSTDENTGMETSTALRSQTSGTYAFSDTENYEAFKEEAEEQLGENYTVTSTDLNQYEQSLLPLENLSKYAGYFLLIILMIGGIILVVLNIFNIRERKYEIGVLAAIGMKKGKIAVQFILELLCVTFAAIIIGAGIGAAASVPITNKLLEQQTKSTASMETEQTENFGRPPGMQGGSGGGPDMLSQGSVTSASANYISKISSATDLSVILKLAGIGILLTILSGCVAVIFILRYDPLRILSSRD